MKKFFVTTAFLALFAGYAINQYLTVSGSSSDVALASTTAQSSQSTPPPETSTIAQADTSNTTTNAQTSAGGTPGGSTTSSGATVPSKQSGQYLDGTYTGSSVYAFYGYVQVQAVVSGGKLTDVSFLQYPNDRGDSIRINQRAMPVLKSEAISAQSANVNGVSGASDTSVAFRESLSSALQQAANS